MQKDYAWYPNDLPIQRESDIHPHVPEEKAHLFEATDGGSTELEVLNFLYACIRVMKPEYVLETGGWQGIGTVALAAACKANGFGKVISLEFLPEQCVRIEQLLEENRVHKYAEVVCMDSISYLQQNKQVFDIGFFDSEPLIRPEEARICLENKTLKKLAVFHDTSPLRVPEFQPNYKQVEYRQKVLQLSNDVNCSGFYDSQLSRGFIALWLKG
jgi:predicted O-methyltransferase YrrM